MKSLADETLWSYYFVLLTYRKIAHIVDVIVAVVVTDDDVTCYLLLFRTYLYLYQINVLYLKYWTLVV